RDGRHPRHGRRRDRRPGAPRRLTGAARPVRMQWSGWERPGAGSQTCANLPRQPAGGFPMRRLTVYGFALALAVLPGAAFANCAGHTAQGTTTTTTATTTDAPTGERPVAPAASIKQ